MKTKTDTSYGVVPVRWTESGWEVFLIHQFSRIGDNSYWILPKGHPEEGELPLETAVRELREETALTAERLLSEPTFELKYTFVYEGKRIDKTVIFFVGIVSAESDHSVCETEVKEGGWYPIEEASKRLDYQDTKEMFAKAKEFIETL